ncbi:MAG: hypothetical protein ACI8SA_002622 [Dokdonia sp.]|jgi:hypothetical protein
MAIGTIGTVALLLSVLFKVFELHGTIALFQTGIMLFSVFGLWTISVAYFSDIKMRFKILWLLLMVALPFFGVWIYHMIKK